MEKTPLAVQLGEFVARLRVEELPAAVVDKAKACVNHAVTVGMAGAASPRALAAQRAVLEHERLGARRVGAGQGATLWVDGTRVTRAGAAFANGVAGGGANHRRSSCVPPTPRGPITSRPPGAPRRGGGRRPPLLRGPP